MPPRSCTRGFREQHQLAQRSEWDLNPRPTDFKSDALTTNFGNSFDSFWPIYICSSQMCTPMSVHHLIIVCRMLRNDTQIFESLSHWCCLHLWANCNSQFRFLSDVFFGNEGIRAWGIKRIQCAEHISWTELRKCKLKRPGVSVGHIAGFHCHATKKLKSKPLDKNNQEFVIL